MGEQGTEQESEDEKQQRVLREKTTKEASDPALLRQALLKLGPVERTPEQERELQEKLDRLQAKIARIKERQSG